MTEKFWICIITHATVGLGLLHVVIVIMKWKKMQLCGGAMQAEANLPWTSAPCAIFYCKCISRKCLTLKILVKVMEYNIGNGSIWWQISTSIKVILEQFSLTLSVFEIFTFQNSWPWKCKSFIHSLRRHSMAHTRLSIWW